MTRQLATLIDAAVPVDEALAMIAAQQESAGARRIVGDVHAGVLEGRRLADALARHPASFSGLYRAAVSGGERAGELGFVLTRLADYLGRAHAMRAKVSTAMIYPAALSLVALTVVVCLMIFVVPSLTEQFERFDQNLPLLTQILIGLSGFLTQFWPLILLALALGAYGLRLMLPEVVREALDAFALRAPLIGRWAVSIAASRFVRAVSTLACRGCRCWKACAQRGNRLANRAAAKAVALMAARIEEGEPLSAAMRRSGVIPPMVAYMTQRETPANCRRCWIRPPIISIRNSRRLPPRRSACLSLRLSSMGLVVASDRARDHVADLAIEQTCHWMKRIWV